MWHWLLSCMIEYSAGGAEGERREQDVRHGRCYRSRHGWRCRREGMKERKMAREQVLGGGSVLLIMRSPSSIKNRRDATGLRSESVHAFDGLERVEHQKYSTKQLTIPPCRPPILLLSLCHHGLRRRRDGQSAQIPKHQILHQTAISSARAKRAFESNHCSRRHDPGNPYLLEFSLLLAHRREIGQSSRHLRDF